MNIKEIHAKLLKGEALTEPEKAFITAYDPEKEKNDAAAAARRKAEEERDTAKADADKLRQVAADAQKADDDAKKAAMTETQRKEAELVSMKTQLENLTKAKIEAETKSAATQRSQAIRDAAKAAGISLAPKTVSERLFFQMLEATLSGVDIASQTALTAALDAFKGENPGIIAAPGTGSGVNPGAPGGAASGKNPWAKDSINVTEQVNMFEKEPDKARSMAAEAGVKL